MVRRRRPFDPVGIVDYSVHIQGNEKEGEWLPEQIESVCVTIDPMARSSLSLSLWQCRSLETYL